MPSLMFFNFESMGLQWLWNALGEEILMLADEANGIEYHEGEGSIIDELH
jgi:hypothetical protein